jgi:endo-1,4-beta-D-glucanase Y
VNALIRDGVGKPVLLLIVFGIVGLIGLITNSGASSYPAKPFPVLSTYSQGIVTPNHLSRKRQNALVAQVYDRWKANYLVEISEKGNLPLLYRIAAGKKDRKRTISEGQGYGLMLSAYMAGYDPSAQEIFDGLFRFVKQNPSRIEPLFMAYQVPIAKERRDSAFDGDADIAFALLLADAQWSSSGELNYRNEALQRINALSTRTLGRNSHLPMLGDWVEQDGNRYNQYSIRSSDLLISHFKIFGVVTENNRWKDVVSHAHDAIEQMQSAYSPDCGLLPDFFVRSGTLAVSYKPAQSKFLESRFDGNYYYNAARVPWRLITDALLFNDQHSFLQVQRIGRWALQVSRADPASIGPGFYLDGKRLRNEDYLSKAFIAPLGTAAMTVKDAQQFVNKVFDLCVSTDQDYYEDSIGLFCLLLMTGNTWIPEV